MATKYERDIYLFLSLYRFFAYGLAVLLIQVVPQGTFSGPSLQTYVLIGIVGVYTLLKVLGPLRWWRQDPATYLVLWGDVLVCLLVLLLTGGLDSPYLLFSLTPVITSALLFREEQALLVAALLAVALTVAHVAPTWWDARYTWIMQGNYLLWLVLYISAAFVIVTIVYRANLNIRGRIEMGAVLEERRRMRREIHDGLAQTLTYLSLKAEAASKLMAQDRLSEAKAAVDEVHSLTRESYHEVRESIDQLGMDAATPLASALAEYVGGFGETNGIPAHFDAPPVALRLPPKIEFQLLRIAKEALSNVRRHAQATEAWVTLDATPEAVELAVRDNGRGFVPAETLGNGSGHHGLKVMQERAEGLGGTLRVTSSPGQGTEVRVCLPRRKWRV